MLNVPARSDEELVVVVHHVPVFQDAAHLHVRHGEDFLVSALRAALHNLLVEGFSRKRNHRPIAVDRPAFDLLDGKAVAFVVGQLHVGIGLAGVGEDLDPHVVTDVVLVFIVDLLVIEEDGRRTGNLRLRGHAQFLGRGRRPVLTGESRT